MSIVIDLKTKVISRKQKVWRVYPGTKREFVSSFRDCNCVFLEVPGISLTKKDLTSGNVLYDKIAMSRSIAKWHKTGEKERGSFPSRKLEDYSEGQDRHSLGMARANVTRLYSDAKSGDLVIVPVDDGFKSVIYIGEIESDFAPTDLMKVEQFGTEDVPFRKVKWLNVNRERRLISLPLSDEIGGRRAVKEVDKEVFGIEIFRMAYGNFVFENDFQFFFAGETYEGDPETTVPGIQLLSKLISISNAAVSGDVDIIRNSRLEQLRRTSYRNQDLVNFEIAFASPGGYRVWLSRAITGLVLISVAGALNGDVPIHDLKEITIVNSLDPNSNIPLEEVQRAYQDVMGNLSDDKIRRLMEEYQDAKEGVGFDAGVEVTDANNVKVN